MSLKLTDVLRISQILQLVLTSINQSVAVVHAAKEAEAGKPGEPAEPHPLVTAQRDLDDLISDIQQRA